jgi:ABC-type branched-subunit amino acid transport system ATPase component
LAVLDVENVRKSFGGTVALNDVSVSIAEGSIIGMVGPNGSGKTTLLNIIAGALPADSGSIRFDGHDITGLEANKIARLGLVRSFQISRPFPSMTVLENVLAASHAGTGPEVRSRAIDIIRQVGLERVIDNRAHALSFGQQRLIELARILMLRPKMILLDEPAAGVNPTLMEHIKALILSLNREGATILVVEHNIRLVSQMCERLIVLNNSEKIADAPLADVLQNPAVKEAYLGSGRAVRNPKHRIYADE